MADPIINAIGTELTDGMKQKITEEILKHEKLLRSATKIDVKVKSLKAHRGVENDFLIEVNIHMPRALVRIEEQGDDVYKIMEQLTDNLARRLKRYWEQKRHWEKDDPWKVAYVDEIKEEGEADQDNTIDNYSNFEPKIAKRKKAETYPMHPAEAIEKMELGNHDFYLFRNSETDKYTVVYKRANGTYGLIEPE